MFRHLRFLQEVQFLVICLLLQMIFLYYQQLFRIYDIHLKTTENKEEIKVKYISNIRKKLFRKFEKK